MIFTKSYGIDTGSDTIKVYSLNRDYIKKEKNRIAVLRGESCLATGNQAFEMEEKTPQDVEVSTPLAGGFISNVMYQEVILHEMLRKMRPLSLGKPRLYFAVPTDLTEIEKRAYYSLASAGEQKGKVFLIPRPIADAYALGISVKSTKGDMIVNIGAQSTEISVIADRRVILSRVCRTGGDALDQSIMDDIRKRQQLFIGHRTAARLKTSMADLSHEKKEARIVMGISSITGLPKEVPVNSAIITAAVEERLTDIVAEIRSVLQRTPPQVRTVIELSGINVLGGTSMLPGIDQYLADALGLSIRLSGFADEGTVHGLREIMRSRDLRKTWAGTSSRKQKNF